MYQRRRTFPIPPTPALNTIGDDNDSPLERLDSLESPSAEFTRWVRQHVCTFPPDDTVRHLALAWSLEDCLKIEVFDLDMEGMLDGSGEWTNFCWTDGNGRQVQILVEPEPDPGGRLTQALNLTITTDEEGQRYRAHQRVPIRITSQVHDTFHRYLACPSCGARVRTLAMPPGESVFGCRNCLMLVPPCRQRRRGRGDGA